METSYANNNPRLKQDNGQSESVITGHITDMLLDIPRPET